MRTGDDQRLAPAALAFRAAHAGIAAGFLSAIVYVWACAISGRRDPMLGIAVGALTLEGVVVAANGGDCPLGPLQDRLDDPVPLFELVLSPSAAKRAIPVLGAVAATGIALLARSTPTRYPAAAAPGDASMSPSSEALTPRGTTITGHCASAVRRGDMPPSTTARSGP